MLRHLLVPFISGQFISGTACSQYIYVALELPVARGIPCLLQAQALDTVHFQSFEANLPFVLEVVDRYSW